MGILVRVDERGRITIPRDIREKAGPKALAKLYVEDGKLIIEPLRDPLGRLEALVVREPEDVESGIASLRRAAEEELLRRLRERWPS